MWWLQWHMMPKKKGGRSPFHHSFGRKLRCASFAPHSFNVSEERMRDFEWESASPLPADLVGRVAAGFGIPFAVVCILAALNNYKVVFGFLLLAVVTGIVAARSAPRTKIKLRGNCLRGNGDPP
jgi:hypothetical protein